jgi:hypothetical protein
VAFSAEGGKQRFAAKFQCGRENEAKSNLNILRKEYIHSFIDSPNCSIPSH